ncbi:MAG TPA: caspase family protein [Herpetosiphonaceae bacterium]
MSRTVYALLVGIDRYPRPIPPLRGCVNDIQVIETLLRERVAGGEFVLEPLVLTNEAATRQAVIDGFRQHLGKAGRDDIALFYYSGHGSQEQSPPEFWEIEPDHLDETLVCYDSRFPGRYDLADKELSKLIAELAAREPQIVVVLDCCHSGSGTRASEAESVRRAPIDLRPRPLDSFLVSPSEVPTRTTRGTEESATSLVALPRGRHIVMAACRDEEEAKEYQGDGQHRGAFSYFLTQTLERAGGRVSYRDLFKRAQAQVQGAVLRQAPQIEASDVRDLNLPFLGGAVTPRAATFTLSHSASQGWTIDGGAVHGIAQPVTIDGRTETTKLALFPITVESLEDLSASVGRAEVTEVLPQLSKVAVTLADGTSPDSQETYKAIVTSIPLPPLAVRFEGDDSLVGAARSALAASGPGGSVSPYVREASADEPFKLRLIAQPEGYRIARAEDDRPLVADIEGTGSAAAQQAIARLEHIARWQTIAALANPVSRIAPGAVQIEIQRVSGPPVTRDPSSAPVEALPATSELRLEYEYRDGQWQQPQIKIKLTNTGDEPLYCALLDLSESYAISSNVLAGGGTWLQPGESAWSNDGKPLFLSVPKAFYQQGVTEYKDLIKLIVSTDACDATLLEQDALDLPRQTKATRGTGPSSTLNRLMRQAQTRDLSDRAEDEQRYADWTTSEISITTVRPLGTIPVPRSGNPLTLGAGVTIAPHPALEANARLTTVSQAGRDLGNQLLPAILRDDPTISQPLQFTESRASDPGLSVLELLNVADHTVVTPEQPLMVRIDQSLSDDEQLLPVGFDGELFLPLGLAQRDGGTTEVRLDRLPAPVVGARSLTGSIRILFQKVVTQRIGKYMGWKYDYPILAAAYVADDGKVSYWPRPGDVKQRVATADRILIYIHGIIGDTRGMAASARVLDGKLAPPPPALLSRYDLILTFDYENINTTIEETARALKQRLQAVGLGPGDGKHVHIVAHSMGGLVSRWFVEREGGNRIVEKLVLLGTPNAGSPWPTVQTWATAALGLALNSLPVIGWPGSVLSSLLGAIETADVTLDQMAPGSPFFEALDASDDPGIPYVVLAGNTSLIPAALAPTNGDGDSGLLSRLLSKLTLPNALHAATALAFFGQPNDIAVSVRSITNINDQRSPQPVVREIACDHITYFSTVAGLQALAEALPDD